MIDGSKYHFTIRLPWRMCEMLYAVLQQALEEPENVKAVPENQNWGHSNMKYRGAE